MLITQENIKPFYKDFNAAKIVVVDIESNGLNVFAGDKLIGIAVYYPEFDRSYYLPFRHEIGNLLPETLRTMATWFFDEYHTYVLHNSKFDLIMMSVGDDFGMPTKMWDTMVMAHLLDENKPKGLKYLGERFLKLPPEEEIELLSDVYDVLIEKGERKVSPNKDKKKAKAINDKARRHSSLKGRMALLPPEKVMPYAEGDVRRTWGIYKFMLPHTERWGTRKLLVEICNEYILKALIPSQILGVNVDRNYLEREEIRLIESAEELLIRIKKLVGRASFNPNSSQQVCKALKSKDAQEATLLKMERKGIEVAKLIVDYKKTKKATSFVSDLLERSVIDGKIHTTWHESFTVTGRLSSREPNLQQMPKISDIYRIRPAFVAPDGHYIVEVDWKRQEMVIYAHLAQQQDMLGMLRDDVDTHQHTADVLGVSRAVGKAANFGLAYGMGGKTAYAKWWQIEGMTQKRAYEIVDDWRSLYSNVVKAGARYQALAKKSRPIPNDDRRSKYLSLWTGRCKHFNSLDDYATLKAFNFMVQGMGAEYNRKLIQYLANNGAQLLMFIHDSAFFLVKEEELDDLVLTVRKFETIIQGDDYPELDAPLTVDIQYGKRWGELVEYD